jgi:hypothetical protein
MRGIHMARRMTAAVALIALALSYLPSVIDSLIAAQPLVCCSGSMCPMHRLSGDHSACDMDPNQQGAALQSCPSPALHYAAAPVFVRVAPPAIVAERQIEAAHVLQLPAPFSIDAEVLSPPPRLAVS